MAHCGGQVKLSRNVVILLACGASVAIAQTAGNPQQPSQPNAGQSQQAPSGQKTAAEQFKNIQVLKTVPAEDLLPTMRYIAAALGTECDTCHVRDNGQFQPEKDDKKPKQTAREMMKMVMTINQENFNGRQEVSCNSCHNGHERPQTIPPTITEAAMKERIAERDARQARAQQQGQQPPQAAPAQQGQPAAQGTPSQQAQGGPGQGPQQGPPRPSAESVFQKYEQAIGGSAAIDKITSRYIKGTISSPFGNQDFEQYNKAPDKFWLALNTPRGQRVQAWDGSQGWTKDNRVQPMRDTTDTKFNSDFYRTLKLTNYSKQARVFRKEKVNDKDCWVVMVRWPDTPFTDMLYFDVDSGLLVRRVNLRRTALGPLPNTSDVSDYRDVNGVKMPFKIVQSNPDSIQNITVSEIKTNVPVDDAKFAMPKDTPSGGN